MKTAILTLVLFGFLAGSGFAVPAEMNADPDGLAAPYFLVQGDPDTDAFPLLKTEAKVAIAGMSSDVELTQVYKNNGKKTLEAVYVFPLGTRAAVHAMKMRIGKRVIEAQIEETKKARETYAQAQQNGQTASLLEQKRPNVFQMNVANILPGDVIEVVVKYTEVLVPEQGTYSFVFPTVVGPRFTGESDSGETAQGTWTATPYLHEGEPAPYDLDIRVTLKTGIPLAKVWSPSHSVTVQNEGTGEATILLSPGDEKKGNRDFILDYTLNGNAIQTGLLLYPSEKENYFLMMMEPPQRVPPERIPPREYLFIVDVSGSMHGFPLDTSKALITRIIDGLRPTDYFNIMFFSGGSEALSASPLPATGENREKARRMLDSCNGGGGTELLAALKKAYSLGKREGMSRIIVAATDGNVDVEKESFKLIHDHLNEGNFFAFGIGTSVNRYLIEGMARAGRGEPFVVTNPEEAAEQATRFFTYTQAPLLTDIVVGYDGFNAYDVEPAATGDLFAERPIVLFGKYRKAEGTIVIRGRTARGSFLETVPVIKALEKKENAALQYLWAREKIARLSDYAGAGEDTRNEVTKLGLACHLMTGYTSFVAVDSEKRATGGAVTVRQPLPLPDGVSNYAVGGICMQNCSTGAMPCGKVCAESAAPVCGTVVRDGAATEMKGRSQQRGNAPRRGGLYVAGGSFIGGISAGDFEKIYLAGIKGGLERLFARNGLISVRLALEVRNGAVVAVKMLNFRGRQYQPQQIHWFFKILRFPSRCTGTMEFELKYY